MFQAICKISIILAWEGSAIESCHRAKSVTFKLEEGHDKAHLFDLSCLYVRVLTLGVMPLLCVRLSMVMMLDWVLFGYAMLATESFRLGLRLGEKWWPTGSHVVCLASAWWDVLWHLLMISHHHRLWHELFLRAKKGLPRVACMHRSSSRILLHVKDHVLDVLAAWCNLLLDLLSLVVLLLVLHRLVVMASWHVSTHLTL